MKRKTPVALNCQRKSRLKGTGQAQRFAQLRQLLLFAQARARLRLLDLRKRASTPLRQVSVGFPGLIPCLTLLLSALSVSTLAETACETREVETLRRIEEKTTCLLLPVPLDHDHPNGDTIDLRVVTLPATSRNPASDPMVFIAGGPGQSSVRTAPFFQKSHAALRTDRDFIFVDQRGTGGSASLACASDLEPLFSKELQWWMTQEAAIQAQKDALSQCLKSLPWAPTHFTTQAAVEDLALVLKHLGYDRVNLLGVSYGTRMALSFLRNHENLVRTLILDAVAPHSMVIPERVTEDAKAAMTRVIEACKLEEACSNRFPGLGALLEGATERLEATQGPISATDPLTGETIEITTWPNMLSNILRAGLYSRELIRLFPLALESGSQGDFDPLVTIAAMLAQESPEDLSLGMMASVLCSEDMTRLKDVGIDQIESNPLQDSMTEICRFWPHEQAQPSEFAPVKSDVPTLLLSGQFDPITPSHYAETLRPDLSQMRHVIVAGGAHGVSSLGCIPDLIENFINTPKPDELDPQCAKDIKVAPFFLSPAGAFRN